jgi:pilus assembly protein FimV
VQHLKFQQLSLALVLALSSSAAYALSLGQVQMRSSLGQPLLAEIPVYDADDADAKSLNVSLGTDDAFRRLGLDPKLYKDVQIQVLSNENGQYYIQLQTSMPFNEPFFNVLLAADWQNGGRLVREFSALVDPPYIANTAVQTIDTPTVILSPVVADPEVSPIAEIRTPSIATGSAPAQLKLAAKPIAKSVAAKPKAVVSKPANAPATSEKTAVVPPIQTVRIPATQGNQLLVKQGDNLNNIAIRQQQQLGPTSISLNQMMNAIQRANPEAFINGNKNLLKTGSIVRLPNEQQVVALLPEDAANLLQKQWANKIMAQPAPVLSSANKLNRQSPTRQPQAAAVKTPVATAVNQGRLKIIPTEGVMSSNAGSQSGASRSGQGQELRAENTRSQEEGAARQAEISTLKNQLSDAEALQIESKRLIELQSSQIKLLTKRMQDLEKTGSATVAATQSVTQNQATDATKTTNSNAWYFSPFVILAGLLLIAGLLGMLLKQKRK